MEGYRNEVSEVKEQMKILKEEMTEKLAL